MLLPRVLLLRTIASPRMMAVSDTVVSVEMAGFLPRLPSLDLQAPVTQVLNIDGGTPCSLEWMADTNRLALINDGRQWSWDGEEVLEIPRLGAEPSATCHAPLGLRLATISADGFSASGVDEGMSATPLPNTGAEPRLIRSLTNRRLLLFGPSGGGDWGIWLWSGEEEGGACEQLAAGLRPVSAACISDAEDLLYLALDDGVYRMALDIEAVDCGPLSSAVIDTPSPAPSLATDKQGNIYVCSQQGVRVCDEEGEESLLVRTPDAATSCCFGGPALSTLYVSAAESIWALRANTQGVAAPSERRMRFIEKQVGAGDRRHAGW